MPTPFNQLYILPFDHRASFIRAFLGDAKDLTPDQRKLIETYKKNIFEGFLLSLGYVEDPLACAILVDDEFGSDIIKLARKKNITFCLPVEKSGQKIFAFQYGQNFSQHILDFQPQIVKALVRYNPAHKVINSSQLGKLKQLSNWCHEHAYQLMIELLVPPTALNLKHARGKQENYDAKIRPALTLKSIAEFHNFGVYPDIWKIEAFESAEDWQKIITLIRDDGRDQVAIIMLGRGESFAKVKQWMNIAPRQDLNGFAVGRTVFLRPLLDLHQRKISKKQVIHEIAKNYLELIRYWQK